MTDEECHLLRENKGCFKCCKPFAGHLARDGACDFPSPTNYILVMQPLIMLLKRSYQAKKHIAAVTHSQIESSTSSVAQESEAHPIVVFMPGVSNLVTYHATNMLTVFDETNSSENTNVSNIEVLDFHKVVVDFIENINSPKDMMTWSPKENSSQMSSLAPLMVPHLFWRVSISPQGSLPLSFDCLIDDGSHLVLIHKSLVKQLQLHCHKLHLPIETKLVMRENDKKITVTLHKYVHLSLFDESGQYST